jgi:CHAD domain-containing protein
MPRSTERYDLLHTRLERFTQASRGVEKGDVRAVHRTRVASRRLREVLPVLQLDADVFSKLRRRLRRITDRLGTIRELDVLLGVLDELSKAGRHPQSVLALIAAAVDEERGRKGKRLLAKDQLRELHRIGARLDKLARTLESQDTSAPRVTERRSWRWAIDARVARRAATLAAAVSRAGTVYLPERLHDVRIAVKKLRYALELSVEVARVKASPDLKQLRRTQDVLGRLHDLHLLMDRARDAQALLTPPDINVWRQLDALVTSLEDSCRRLHGRYMKDRNALLTLCADLSGRTQEAKAVRNRAL